MSTPETSAVSASSLTGALAASTSTAQDFRSWAATDAHGRSPSYERLALAIADDDRVITLLQLVSSKRRKPDLLFGVLRMHGAPVDRPEVAIEWIVDHPQLVLKELRERRIQTNEVRRATALMPAIASVAGDREIALIELGASAGLLLNLDRYQYLYETPAGQRRVGDPSSPVTLGCAVRGGVPIPERVPTIARRIGVDTHPIDVRDRVQRKWLEALVWPEHTGRRERLSAALNLAAIDPPRVMRSDMLSALQTLLERVPFGVMPVVIHAVTMPYVDAAKQAQVVDLCHRAGVPRIGLEARDEHDTCLALTLDTGTPRQVATVQPHGEWIEALT